MRLPAFVAVAVLLTVAPTLAQDPPPEEKAWSFSASAYTYLVPDSRDYVQPGLAADRNRLHLAVRYNYEDLETGSVWLGCNFSGGERVAWEFTPMLGGVLGTTAGVAPGYTFSLSFWKLELASEAEYVVDARETADSFFYTWSELSVSPVASLRVGAVVQRTKAYQTAFDIQRGLLAGLRFEHVDLTAYVFNPDTGKPAVVIGVVLGF